MNSATRSYSRVVLEKKYKKFLSYNDDYFGNSGKGHTMLSSVKKISMQNYRNEEIR